MTAKAAKATTGDGQMLTRTGGIAHKNTPSPKSFARLPLPERLMATNPPMMEPMPITALRKPTPRAPIPTTSSAISTVNTIEAPVTRVWAQQSSTSNRSRPSWPIVRKPAETSEAKLSLFSGSSAASAPPPSGAAGAAGSTNREISDADQMKVATLSTKTAGTSATPSSSAPRAGPTKKTGSPACWPPRWRR